MQEEAQLAKAREEIAQKIAMYSKSHNEFITNISKDIKRIEKSNKRLDKVLDKLETKNIFDHEELHHEILTHEEILAQHKNHKEYYAKQEALDKEHKEANNKLQELNKEIANLKKQL
ncbi:MAG: hypothetical protein RCO49_01310 [Rickettsia endosymbiont of Argas persicus]